MPTTETVAYQEMCARLREVVTSQAMSEAVGYVPELRYQDINYGNKTPAPNKLWLKFAIVQAGEKSRTLGKPARVRYSGIAAVQLFVPVSDTDAAKRGRIVADLVKGGMQSSTANVDFYKAAVKDMPQADQWFYKRIAATYNFSQYEGK